MSTFSEFEEAVRDKRITYKEMVEMMYSCAGTGDAVRKLFDQLAISEDDPKVLRKKHRDAQVEKFGDDKEAIKSAMSDYDKSIRASAPPGEAKPKPKPPIRAWTEEEKVYTKAKNAYVKSKEKEYGDDVTVADLKVLRKKWRKEYDGEHKAPKAEPVAEDDVEEEPEAEEEPEPVAEDEDEVEAEEEPEDSANPFDYYEDDNSSDEERERQEDERERELERKRQEDERERELELAKLQEEEAKPKPTKEQKARYKVLQKKGKETHTAEEKAEYKALKKALT